MPYVLFETAYPLFKNLVTGSHEDISLLDPWYLTWFLVALFVWRLTTPVWKLVRRPLPLAVGIAMLATVSPEIGDDLDLQRVLQFLPYFVLGLCMKTEHFQLVRRRWVRIASVPVFAAALAFGWWAVPAHEHRVVLPPRLGTGTGCPVVVRPGDDARADGLLAGADGRLLRLGAAPEDVVHGARRGHALRLPAARLPGEARRLPRLVRPLLAAPPARRDPGDRARRGRRHGAVHAAGAAPVSASRWSRAWSGRFRQDAAGPARERHEQREKASA
ncbi:hypothetical protein GCM10017687_61120 [Streptomyces echinatus]